MRIQPRRAMLPSMNLGIALVMGAALIAGATAVTHRYVIKATACNPSEAVCSRAWLIDQWTGAMTFCEYKGLPDCVRVRASAPKAAQ